ncbi:MAG: hypothetical protein COC22_01530 [Flavobacteriaceae bacterium]|nr:MAG: hypothetical protein COC22_01530 [Flavobacteriaceae bacterium]
MKKFIGLMVMIIFISSCNTGKKGEVEIKLNVHKIVLKEALQVKGYTYLLVDENGIEKWLAAPSFTAEVGKTYYFKNGLEMPNFESKELNRTFVSIYFVDQISEEPNFEAVVKANNPIKTSNSQVSQQATKPVIEKEAIKIKATEGVTTIAELIEKAKNLKGTVIKVKGKVTKFNPEIMNKNWIHIQDGTEFKGEFDLTVTTLAKFKVGDIITLEGKVSLDKDFGFGYFYKIILEDAVLAK